MTSDAHTHTLPPEGVDLHFPFDTGCVGCSPSNPAFIAATSAALGVPTPVPCTPVTPAPWAPGVPTVLITNIPVLDNTCKLVCSLGGMISITFPSQVTHNVP